MVQKMGNDETENRLKVIENHLIVGFRSSYKWLDDI